MANTIEIRVRATDDTKATYDAAKAKALEAGTAAGQAYSAAYARAAAEDYQPITPSRVTGRRQVSLGPTPEEIAEQKAQIESLRAEFDQAGVDMGEDLTDSVSDTVDKELGPKLKDPVKKSGSDSASAFVSGFQSNLDSSLSGSALTGISRDQGEKFSISFGQGVKDSIADANLAGILGDALGDSTEDVIGPDSTPGKKIKDDAKKTGQEAGQDMGESMSPLIATAIGGAAAVGAPLLLAGMGVAFAGVAALALKNNVVIKNDFANVASSAEKSFTSAAAPLTGTLHQALVGVGQTAQQIEPQLKGMFVNVQPDITAVAGGVDSFAKGVLPGLSSALGGSQVIVSDFSNSLGPLGSNVGGFFQGLTRDANTTGAGLESLVGTAGHLVSTLGGTLGSAASVGSTALMGLDPVINTTLSLIQKIDSPGVVGAGAGLFAAFKIDPSIQSGLMSFSSKLGDFAKGSVNAEGEMSGLGKAASGLGGAFEKSAGVVGGPWGLAIGAGIGLATGLAGAIINASKASDALTLSQQGLDQAVQQDNGHIGAAVGAYVAAQAQADGLATSATNAGVSLATWTQAVIGNKGAQDQVTASVKAANQVVQNQTTVADASTQVTGRFGDSQQIAATRAQAYAASQNTLTDKNKQLLASMQAENAQIVQAVTKQAQLQAATNALTNSTDIFTASLGAQHQAQIASEQQTALASVASMNLGTSQVTLSQKIYQAEIAYQGATTGAQGYQTALTALNGTTMNMDQAQVTLAQQMLNAKTSFAQNKYSMDLSTQAGINNKQALNQAATAITAMGVAQYQATGDINKGNSTIQQQVDAFVKATGATGKAKTAIEQYLDQISKIPANKSTNVTVRITDPGVLNKLNDPRLSEAHGGNIGAAATGGARGALTLVGEQGPEMVNLPYGSSVMTNSNLNSMMAGGFGASIGGGSGGVLQIEFAGNTDTAFATFFTQLVRTGKIKIKRQAIVG